MFGAIFQFMRKKKRERNEMTKESQFGTERYHSPHVERLHKARHKAIGLPVARTTRTSHTKRFTQDAAELW